MRCCECASVGHVLCATSLFFLVPALAMHEASPLRSLLLLLVVASVANHLTHHPLAKACDMVIVRAAIMHAIIVRNCKMNALSWACVVAVCALYFTPAFREGGRNAVFAHACIHAWGAVGFYAVA